MVAVINLHPILLLNVLFAVLMPFMGTSEQPYQVSELWTIPLVYAIHL